jgi:hypothetical protein
MGTGWKPGDTTTSDRSLTQVWLELGVGAIVRFGTLIAVSADAEYFRREPANEYDAALDREHERFRCADDRAAGRRARLTKAALLVLLGRPHGTAAPRATNG